MERVLEQLRPLDLFGYIVPGMLCVVGIAPSTPIALQGRLAWVLNSSVVTVVVLITISYAVGFVISYSAAGFSRWFQTHSFSRKKERWWFEVKYKQPASEPLAEAVAFILKERLGDRIGEIKANDAFQIARQWNSIRKTDIEVSRTMAMNRLASGLSAAAMLICLFYVLFWIFPSEDAWIIMLTTAGLIFSVAAAWATKGDTKTFRNQMLACTIATHIEMTRNQQQSRKDDSGSFEDSRS